MGERLGVRWRLLLAFFGISALALVAAAAAMYAFVVVGELLERITQERVPPALASLELSRQAGRVVTAAPAFLAATTRQRHQEVSGAIAVEVEHLGALLANLRKSGIAPDTLAAVEPAIDGLERNLGALDALVARRIELAERKTQLLGKLASTSFATQRLVAPGVLVMDSKLAEWRRAVGEAGADAADGVVRDLASEITVFMPQQKAQIEISAINDALIKAADAQSVADLPLMAFPLRRSLATLEAIAEALDAKLRPRLLARLEEFRGLMDGKDSIFAARNEELTVIGHVEALLAENLTLSREVGAALDRLVDTAKRDIDQANQDAVAAQRIGSGVVIGMVLLSLISSGLIVWLYVSRNLIARLTALSDSMLAIAGGNLRAALPKPGSRDEIGRMAEALTVFRNTAVEVEDNNLREVAQARQRLVDAIESISEGFAFYDAEDRLQLCNTPYKTLLYGGTEIDVEPGITFEAVIRRAVEKGLVAEAGADPGRYIEERLAQHRDPSQPLLQRRSDGRWILISERRVGGGGTVAVYSDITTLKQRELALEEANQQIGQKHHELEALSSKLAKYLSPQVYQSIFSGKQEVRITSQRKKLTVFFSDIAGFTAMTDRLESEELTVLLNQYLTEMSRIALEHGATIDKYVGDGIMIFFGDPDSAGLKQDALTCVAMAIAMQERVRELASVWRDAGIEQPLACRIGIHTGYCTVGNFGGEDRMDYTIIGNAVNLASRLEHEAPPGSILISFETHALVKDAVRCEERGQVEVGGIPYPVATYEAIERYDAPTSAVQSAGKQAGLDLDFDSMSDDERRAAAAMLRQALAKLAVDEPPAKQDSNPDAA